MRIKQFRIALAIAWVISCTQASAEPSEKSIQLTTTAFGQSAQLIYEAGAKQKKVTPIILVVSPQRPQQVSVTIAIDGFERRFDLKAEMNEKAQKVIATFLIPKPDNATYYPSGRKIFAHAFAGENGKDDVISLTLLLAQ